VSRGFVSDSWAFLLYLRPPPTDSAGSIVISCRPSVVLFLRCQWNALKDVHQTSVSSASWDNNELVWFWVQKVKGDGLVDGSI